LPRSIVESIASAFYAASPGFVGGVAFVAPDFLLPPLATMAMMTTSATTPPPMIASFFGDSGSPERGAAAGRVGGIESERFGVPPLAGAETAPLSTIDGAPVDGPDAFDATCDATPLVGPETLEGICSGEPFDGPPATGALEGPPATGALEGPPATGVLDGPRATGALDGPPATGALDGPPASGECGGGFTVSMNCDSVTG
jgi:hypothetical protein